VRQVLPGGPSQCLLDRLDKPLVRIGDDEHHPGQALVSSSERQQASQPALFLANGNSDAEDLSGALRACTPVRTSTLTVLLLLAP
jgi:hypothetical protein